MTDTSNQIQSNSPKPLRRSLPVTIITGMPVVEVADASRGTIVGITQAYCIYRTDAGSLAVASWRDVALANVCPAEPLLPNEVTENDLRNARAAVLRELLALKPFGLSTAQESALNELIRQLCGRTALA